MSDDVQMRVELREERDQAWRQCEHFQRRLVETQAERDVAVADLEAAREALRATCELLRRLREWDQMVGGRGDEPYWRREIDALLPIARAALGES